MFMRVPEAQSNAKARDTPAAERGANVWGDNKPLRGLRERGTRGAAEKTVKNPLKTSNIWENR